MSKIQATDSLIEKLYRVMEGREYIKSGDGFTRTELRSLERAGVLVKSYFREGTTIFCVWRKAVSLK